VLKGVVSPVKRINLEWHYWLYGGMLLPLGRGRLGGVSLYERSHRDDEVE
jgi:hypothetical protein